MFFWTHILREYLFVFFSKFTDCYKTLLVAADSIALNVKVKNEYENGKNVEVNGDYQASWQHCER